MGKRQRTTFAKSQRERARMDKAAEKRARRLARKHGEEEEGAHAAAAPYDPFAPPADRDEPNVAPAERDEPESS
jgi:hypothetical protein